jgi:hypothetical protein
MAVGILQQPSRPRTRKRKLPADAVVYRTYLYERSQREYGAVARVARSLGCSDQHVANVLKRHPGNQPASTLFTIGSTSKTEQSPVDLAYIPAPGELEHAATLANDALLRQLLGVELAVEVPTTPAETRDITEAVHAPALPNLPPLATYELPRSWIGKSANANERRALAVLMWAGALLMTAEVLALAAWSDLRIALVQLPAALGLWWCAAEARRL